MKKISIQYDKKFRLTSDSSDLSDINFKFNTYLKETTDVDLNPTFREYYMSYDSATNTFSDMAVKCSYTYVRNTNNDIIKSIENIEWFFEDGTVGLSKQLIKVYQ